MQAWTGFYLCPLRYHELCTRSTTWQKELQLLELGCMTRMISYWFDHYHGSLIFSWTTKKLQNRTPLFYLPGDSPVCNVVISQNTVRCSIHESFSLNSQDLTVNVCHPLCQTWFSLSQARRTFPRCVCYCDILRPIRPYIWTFEGEQNYKIKGPHWLTCVNLK